jgi:hypothetical protein
MPAAPISTVSASTVSGTTVYDPDAIFHENGPIDPSFMADAIQALMRAHRLETPESASAQQRHLRSSLVALAATNPRDPIEVMLAVQAISAYQAACVCWHIGMNSRDPNRDRLRHMSAAASAARTFDTMLRAMERRQAKPLAVPVGRPEPRIWSNSKTAGTLDEISDRIRRADADPVQPHPLPPTQADLLPPTRWTPEDVAFAEKFMAQERIDKENEGLDIANTEGILPGGGMIMMEHPTPQQAAYMGRRLGLMYRREYQENLRNGITQMPKIRPFRPGDLIP